MKILSAESPAKNLARPGRGFSSRTSISFSPFAVKAQSFDGDSTKHRMMPVDAACEVDTRVVVRGSRSRAAPIA
jgi:hypothetical protein